MKRSPTLFISIFVAISTIVVLFYMILDRPGVVYRHVDCADVALSARASGYGLVESPSAARRIADAVVLEMYDKKRRSWLGGVDVIDNGMNWTIRFNNRIDVSGGAPSFNISKCDARITDFFVGE